MSRWLDGAELRIGLGCMRLGPDGEETIAAAADAGVTIFDTARAYPGNEALLARGLRGRPARIVTKGGMGPGWVPDGRARTIRADCEASLEALDGLPIDLWLVHAPDPRTPWRTTVRALARLADEGLVRHVGVSNVNRPQLDEALELAPVAAVEVALSVLDDRALRGGVVERCDELGIALIAHSPLGGPKRVRSLARRGVTVEEALAWLLALSPVVVAIPGATRPETARSAAAVAHLDADPSLVRRFGSLRRERPRPAAEGDVILVMGVPGAGKSRLAAGLDGYLRLNRDERAGSLRELAGTLEQVLATGARKVVLDNTYLTRASRRDVVDAAARHGLPVRCVWLDTPLGQAQVNLVERLLDRFGALPSPEELKEAARGEQGLLTPTSQMRTLRELEPPSPDEGFASVERVPFERSPRTGAPGVFVAAAAVTPGWASPDPAAPHLVFDWGPEPPSAEIAVAGPVETAVCPHGGGPPSCWCRPPLPGLPLAFARKHGVDPSRSTLVGAGPAHRTLAATLGARYVGV